MRDHTRNITRTHNLRLNRNWDVSLGTRRRVLHRNQLGVNITIELIVYVEVALILQRRSTGGTPETFNMQVLVLDPNKDATERGYIVCVCGAIHVGVFECLMTVLYKHTIWGKR